MGEKIELNLIHRNMWQSSGKFQPCKDELARIVPALVEMGCFARIETNGGVFKQVNLLTGENPDEPVCTCTKVLHETGIKTHTLDHGLDALRMYPVPDDVRALMYRVKHTQGVDIIRLFDGPNDIHNTAPALKWVKEASMTPQGILCTTISPVHTIEYYCKLADEEIAVGTEELYLKDIAGVGQPAFLSELTRCIKEKHPDIIPEYHGHSDLGLPMTSMLEVAKNNIDILDVATESLSRGKVHPDVTSVQSMLRNAGSNILEINMDAYMKARAMTQEFIGEWFGYSINLQNKIMGSLLPSCGLPGGMIGSVMADLDGTRSTINNLRKKKGESELSVDDVLIKLFDEVAYVWLRVSYPPLVAPFLQYVKNIALMNPLTPKQGKSRFVMMDDSMQGMILGKSGRVPGEICQESRDLAKRKGLEFTDADLHILLSNAFDDLRKEMDENGQDYGQDDEELFESAMHPEQYRSHENGQAEKNPLADLQVAKDAKLGAKISPKEAAASKHAKADTIVSPAKGQPFWEFQGDGEAAPIIEPFIGKEYKEGDIFCYVQAPWGEFVTVPAALGGKLVEVNAKQGARVNKGDIIVCIERAHKK